MTTDPTKVTRKITLEGVDFAYGPDQPLVLQDIAIDVAAGELLALVGSSGCGKSTLLRLIAGMVRAERGGVQVDGIDIVRPSSSRGMIFQEDAVFPWLTVAGNVAYGLKAQGIRGAERESTVDSALDLVGLRQARSLYPRELSGGMRKRVDVARSIALRPDVLLMDEPFAALDVMTKEQLQEDFLSVWSAVDMTVVFVTHDLEEALFLADRVVVMAPNPGRLVRQVDVPFGRPRPSELRTDPAFQAMRRDLGAVLAATTEAA